MRVIIRRDYNQVCEWASEYLIAILKDFKPSINNYFVLGLSTGETPLGVYEKLVTAYRQGRISFRYVKTFNMDEYVNLPKDDPNSNYQYMYRNFFSLVDIPSNNINLLDGMALDLEAECVRYEMEIEKVGGIDFFLSGVSGNGHLAFNEPGSSLSSETRIKTLSRSTVIEKNRDFQENLLKTPIMALTIGLKTIMSSREI